MSNKGEERDSPMTLVMERCAQMGAGGLLMIFRFPEGQIVDATMTMAVELNCIAQHTDNVPMVIPVDLSEISAEHALRPLTEMTMTDLTRFSEGWCAKLTRGNKRAIRLPPVPIASQLPAKYSSEVADAYIEGFKAAVSATTVLNPGL